MVLFIIHYALPRTLENLNNKLNVVKAFVAALCEIDSNFNSEGFKLLLYTNLWKLMPSSWWLLMFQSLCSTAFFRYLLKFPEGYWLKQTLEEGLRVQQQKMLWL